ncbi:TetR/AcrR family transcriptional regulator [Micromonospora chokoriensis]|uniref:Transcriptional regulator, TetR family n=1 Tax=Micromonospora chokoriensis TaxID=356851 RepID=A0A1C4YZI4_9ACTN|nr:TetR/AcrR family transcriptional regulator [Micromonospora chokoriensis]SCF26084.1 transcriptional regulator, TetR family [Micromonospora chokoriensis]
MHPNDATSAQVRAAKPLTITEQARRAQLIGVTIDLVARHGYPGTSLARIAEAAGISKAAVLYHFPSKDAVVQTAYASVLESLTAYVGAEVGARSGAPAVEAYVRSLVAYLRNHPDHTRMIVEALSGETGISDTPNARSRREAVAGLIEAARAAGDYRQSIDPQTTAVIVNGAIDAIVSERLADPDFDSRHAAEELVTMLRRSLGTATEDAGKPSS